MILLRLETCRHFMQILIGAEDLKYERSYSSLYLFSNAISSAKFMQCRMTTEKMAIGKWEECVEKHAVFFSKHYPRLE
jgi:hypothetical protein